MSARTADWVQSLVCCRCESPDLTSVDTDPSGRLILSCDDCDLEQHEPRLDRELASECSHVLHLDSIRDEGLPEFRLECTHQPGDWEDWAVLAPVTDCWLQTWWEELGGELLADIPNPTFPLPVKPADDWTDDGGTIVDARGDQ